jgi:hypothetical protein
MRATTAVFVVLVTIGAFLLGTRFPELFRKPPYPNVEEEVRLLDLQRMCAEAADKSFKLAGYKPKQDVINSYLNHYDSKLRKCFVLLSTYDPSTSGTISTFQELDDAFEGTTYGNFVLSQNIKGPGPVTDHFVTCQMQPPGAEQVLCHSREEWDALVNRYMRE